jgi:D-alanine--poly(phosphoribitol) ligase subunit 1
MNSLNLAFSVYCHATTNPTHNALVVDDSPHSYVQLAETASRVATWVRSRAVNGQRPPRVGILGYRSLEVYAAILGTAWAAGTYVPLNPKYPAPRLATLLGQAGLDAMVVDQRGSAVLGELTASFPSAVLLGRGMTADLPGRHITTWEELAGTPETISPLPVPPEHPAYIIFTSGTTGVPKGVVISAASVAHFLACLRSQYHIGPEDRVAQFSETTFDVSVFEMFTTWQGGASLHVVPEKHLMAPAGFIQKEKLTVWSSPPSVIMLLSRMRLMEPGAFPTLRISSFAGEGLPVSSAQAWQAAAPHSVIENQYGPTEATITCISQRLTDPPAETPGRGTLAIGRSYPGMTAGIVGSDGMFLGPGEVGELALSGPQLALGYLDDPEQTARRFPLLDRPGMGPARWYLTGDLACCDHEGRFHVLGRVDNQVKIMGNRVELEEIEAHLRAVCGTDAVAAVAWPVVNGNATGIVAFLCGSQLSLAAVREQLRARLPNFMVPRKVVELESWQLTANGKVDRKRLRNMLDEGDASVRP